MGLKIKQLIWDGWNTRHIKKHQVNIAEIKQACKKIKKSFVTYNNRLIIIGETDEERLLTVVLAVYKGSQYYVVTARDASKKERRLLDD